MVSPSAINHIADQIHAADVAYHSGSTPIISDTEYDALREQLAKSAPNHPLLDQVGAAVPSHTHKVKLPYIMGSVRKVKDDDAAGVLRFLQQTFHAHQTDATANEYIVSDKLDGVSALLVSAIGGVYMYSRGDGIVGHDISHLLPMLSNGSASRCLTAHMQTNTSAQASRRRRYVMSGPHARLQAVRGELIIPRANIDAALEISGGSNARNVVAGQVNSKTPDPRVCRFIRFVPYAVYAATSANQANETAPALDIHEQMLALDATCGSESVVPWMRIDRHTVSPNWLTSRLIDRRVNSPYEINGLIIAHVPGSHRVCTPAQELIPQYMVAFKMAPADVNAVRADVVSVE
jgi:NAD-dependent DNA ligase